MTRPLLQANHLKVHFPVRSGVFRRQTAVVRAVDGVSLALQAGETLGLVGESGCGKTTLGRAVIRLVEPTGGEILFDGQDLRALAKSQLRPLRRSFQMIFQDPFESLNHRHSVRTILSEPFQIHAKTTGPANDARLIELLGTVGLPASALDRFPHEFSGGQRQRIGIARAIALSPRLIVCDEPVSALDVSIQSQVINLLLRLQQEMGLAYLFIAHDLAVVKHISDRVMVMYLGKIVESAGSSEIYRNPLHPYTKALIDAIPVPDPMVKRQPEALSGEIPSAIEPPGGCRFHTRCPNCQPLCRETEPELRETGQGARGPHLTACHYIVPD